MDETTENFWQAWQQLDLAPPPVLHMRLYHDADGWPLFYSREDLPGTFIDLDPVDFALADMNVRVIQGSLTRIDPNRTVHKLVPSSSGTPCHAQDITVVVSPQVDHRCWQSQARQI